MKFQNNPSPLPYLPKKILGYTKSNEGETMSHKEVEDEGGVHGGYRRVELGVVTDSTKALFDSKICSKHTMHRFHSLGVVFVTTH